MLIIVLPSTLFANWRSMLSTAKLDTRLPPMVLKVCLRYLLKQENDLSAKIA